MEGGEFREDFLEEEVSGLNFERRVRGSQIKEIGKGIAVRKQPEQRLGGDVFSGRVTGSRSSLPKRKAWMDNGERIERGSWTLTAVLMSFDFIPRAMGNH